MGFPQNFLWGGATAANQYEGATRRTEKALQSRILLPMATRNSRAGSSTVSRMDVRERSGWANASRRVHRAS